MCYTRAFNTQSYACSHTSMHTDGGGKEGTAPCWTVAQLGVHIYARSSMVAESFIGTTVGGLLHYFVTLH